MINDPQTQIGISGMQDDDLLDLGQGAIKSDQQSER